MVFIACTYTECDFVAQISGLDEEEAEYLIGPKSDWYPDRYPCPKCGERCACFIKLAEGDRVTHVLTAKEAFIAFSGAGMPGEQECSASRVEKLLTEHPITKVHTRHIRGTNRCTLDRLELADGTVLHLGSSTHGACVYRVVGAPTYAEEAELEEASRQLRGNSG